MTARSREHGVALIIVLWLFTVLGVLALDFARFIRDDAMAAVNYAEEAQGYYVALAGLNRTLFAYANEPETQPLDPDEEDLRIKPDGQWHEGMLNEGRYAVRLTDEGGRIPINAGNIDGAEREKIRALLKHVVTFLAKSGEATTGLDIAGQKQIDTIVASIIDWRDSGEEQDAGIGAEDSCPLSRGEPYRAPNRPFHAPEELLHVCGMTPALFYGTGDLPGLRDVVTVWEQRPPFAINVRTAPPAVMRVLLQTDEAAVEELLALRETDKGAFPAAFQTAILQTALGELAAFVSELFPEVEEHRLVFVEAKADVGAERNQSHIAAVADLESDVGDFRVAILNWFDRAPWSGHLPQPGERRAEDAP